MANALVRLTKKFDNIHFVFKASIDKANRTSVNSYRGLGFEEGFDILMDVSEFCQVTTDVHDVQQALRCSRAGFIVQIPAMLSRQTDLLACAASASAVNVKKSLTMSANDLKYAVEKLQCAECRNIWITERGTQFGYNNQVVDFRNIVNMRNIGANKIIYDASHSIQTPSSQGSVSGGQREMLEPLASAAVAIGIDGLFIEVHDDPEHAMSDKDIAYPLDQLEELLNKLLRIDAVRRLNNNHSRTQGFPKVA